MMAKESNGSVRLINVLPVTPVMLAEYVPPDFEAQQRVSAEEAIAIVAKETGLAPDKISTAVLQGNVDREILDEAKRMRADLIVMSSHRTGVRTYFLGSNAGHVVRYAACSVLVVRQRAD
jgi:nucleotide-binding universal stress UspA family protein